MFIRCFQSRERLLILIRNLLSFDILPASHSSCTHISRDRGFSSRDPRNISRRPHVTWRNKSRVFRRYRNTFAVKSNEANDCLRARLHTRNISHLSLLGRLTSDLYLLHAKHHPPLPPPPWLIVITSSSLRSEHSRTCLRKAAIEKNRQFRSLWIFVSFS